MVWGFGSQFDSIQLWDFIMPSAVSHVIFSGSFLIIYSGEHLQDIDVEPFVSKMFGKDLYDKPSFSFVRITSLKATSRRLWPSFIFRIWQRDEIHAGLLSFECLQFRWLKIKRIFAAFPISITLFFNHLKWNSFKLFDFLNYF